MEDLGLVPRLFSYIGTLLDLSLTFVWSILLYLLSILDNSERCLGMLRGGGLKSNLGGDAGGTLELNSGLFYSISE